MSDNVNKRVEKPVAVGKVKKKSEIKKLSDVFLAEDVSSVGNYILMDVVIPAIKKTVSDIVRDGVDMMLFGGKRSSGSSGTSGRYVSYSKMGDRREEYRDHSGQRTRYSHEDIILETRGDAEMVLSQMTDIIEEYDQVAVSDLYDLVGITGNYTDNKYGWTNLRNAEVITVRDGYMLKLPKAIPLK